MRLGTFLILVVLSFAGCATQAPASDGTRVIPVEGRARVVSVDQSLGQAVLEIGGSNVNAYWQVERAYAQGGAVINNGPLTAPVGAYREPVVRPQKFAANPGDLIAYVGLQTGNEILLRSIQVVAP